MTGRQGGERAEIPSARRGYSRKSVCDRCRQCSRRSRPHGQSDMCDSSSPSTEDTNLPFQATRIERRPARSGIHIITEHIETRDPGRLRASLWERVWRIGDDGNSVEELLYGRRD